jgi:hypothetical protein
MTSPVLLSYTVVIAILVSGCRGVTIGTLAGLDMSVVDPVELPKPGGQLVDPAGTSSTTPPAFVSGLVFEQALGRSKRSTTMFPPTAGGLSLRAEPTLRIVSIQSNVSALDPARSSIAIGTTTTYADLPIAVIVHVLDSSHMLRLRVLAGPVISMGLSNDFSVVNAVSPFVNSDMRLLGGVANTIVDHGKLQLGAMAGIGLLWPLATDIALACDVRATVRLSADPILSQPVFAASTTSSDRIVHGQPSLALGIRASLLIGLPK